MFVGKSHAALGFAIPGTCLRAEFDSAGGDIMTHDSEWVIVMQDGHTGLDGIRVELEPGLGVKIRLGDRLFGAWTHIPRTWFDNPTEYVDDLELTASKLKRDSEVVSECVEPEPKEYGLT